MTVSQVMGCGVQKGTPEYEDEIHDEIELLPKQMIMMVLEKDKLKKVLDIIKKELYTGHIGDGKIFVSNITDIIRVRKVQMGCIRGGLPWKERKNLVCPVL